MDFHLQTTGGKTFFKKIVKKLKKIGHNPATDWEIVVGFATGTAALFLVLGIYVFIQINQGEFFVVKKEEDVRVETIDRAALKELLNVLQGRKDHFNALRRDGVRLVDPSL